MATKAKPSAPVERKEFLAGDWVNCDATSNEGYQELAARLAARGDAVGKDQLCTAQGLLNVSLQLQLFLDEQLGEKRKSSNEPFMTKIPATLFRDFQPDGSLALILNNALDLRRKLQAAGGSPRTVEAALRRFDIRGEKYRKPALDLCKQIGDSLIADGFWKLPKIFFWGFAESSSLADSVAHLSAIAKRHGGVIVNSVNDATHIVLPFKILDENDPENYFRVLRGASSSNGSKKVFVHWFFRPDSHDDWLDGGLDNDDDEVEEEELVPPEDGRWKVGYEWLLLLDNYNEWLNELDFEITEEALPEPLLLECGLASNGRRIRGGGTRPRSRAYQRTAEATDSADDAAGEVRSAVSAGGRARRRRRADFTPVVEVSRATTAEKQQVKNPKREAADMSASLVGDGDKSAVSASGSRRRKRSRESIVDRTAAAARPSAETTPSATEQRKRQKVTGFGGESSAEKNSNTATYGRQVELVVQTLPSAALPNVCEVVNLKIGGDEMQLPRVEGGATGMAKRVAALEKIDLSEGLAAEEIAKLSDDDDDGENELLVSRFLASSRSVRRYQRQQQQQQGCAADESAVSSAGVSGTSSNLRRRGGRRRSSQGGQHASTPSEGRDSNFTEEADESAVSSPPLAAVPAASSQTAARSEGDMEGSTAVTRPPTAQAEGWQPNVATGEEVVGPAEIVGLTGSVDGSVDPMAHLRGPGGVGGRMVPPAGRGMPFGGGIGAGSAGSFRGPVEGLGPQPPPLPGMGGAGDDGQTVTIPSFFNLNPSIADLSSIHLAKLSSKSADNPPPLTQDQEKLVAELLDGKDLGMRVPPVVPSVAQWFDFATISSVEREHIGILFQGVGMSEEEVLMQYRTIRNAIIERYRARPLKYLSPTECRHFIDGDAAMLLRLHSFLEHWGLINFQAHPLTLPHRKRQAAQVELEHMMMPRFAFQDSLKPQKDALATADTGVSDAKEIAKRQKHSNSSFGPFKCSSCERLCVYSYFCLRPSAATATGVSAAAASRNLWCLRCVADGNFPSSLNINHLLKVDLPLVGATRDGSKSGWSTEEIDKLIEGIELFSEDWQAVARHVGGQRTAAECVLAFVELEIDEPFGDAEESLQRLEKGASAEQADGATAGKVEKSPFASLPIGDPLMCQLAFLSSMVDPEVARSAAKAAHDTIEKLKKEKHDGGGTEAEAAEEMTIDKTDQEMRDQSSSSSADRAEQPSSAKVVELSKEDLEVACAVALAAGASRAGELVSEEEEEIRKLMPQLLAAEIEKLKAKTARLAALQQAVEAEHARISTVRNAAILASPNVK